MLSTCNSNEKCNYVLIGIEHQVCFVYCDCETIVEAMVHVRLWPSSPSHPQTAYTFELLDWMEALLLECQVALKDFCSALYFKCPHIEKTIGLFIYVCCMFIVAPLSLSPST